jgi:hypothetical protein
VLSRWHLSSVVPMDGGNVWKAPRHPPEAFPAHQRARRSRRPEPAPSCGIIVTASAPACA